MSSLSIGIFRTSLFAAILAVASLSTAHAQHPDRPIKADVPFAFNYGNRHFGPGVYALNLQFGDVLQIQGQGGTQNNMVQLEIDREPAKISKIVFRQYGERYFVEELWTQGSVTHLRCLRSKVEKEVERSYVASRGGGVRNVELALLEEPR